MLADNPNSQGLKDKLANVRAMASATPAAETEAEPIEAEIVEEPLFGEPEKVPTEAPPQRPEPLASPAPEQLSPRLDDWELPATKAVPSADQEHRHAKPALQPKPFDVGFEPREYIPPDAIPVAPKPSGTIAVPAEEIQVEVEPPVEPPLEPPIPSRKLTAAGKKETVDRLEKWLKNIRKEN